MEKPAIELVEELYTADEAKAMVKRFREDGFVILPDVFKRETVDPFLNQLEGLMFHDGLSWRLPDDAPHYTCCAKTPRGFQLLPDVLSRSVVKPFVSMHNTMIIIQKGADDSYIPGWHKDREPDGMPEGTYYCPPDVFVGFYFEDMTEDHGPTLVIPGSHRDVTITPENYGKEPTAIYCRKQDGLLLDQRTWHRGLPRKVDGNRFLLIYAYFGLPHYYTQDFKMPSAQRDAWLRSDTVKDRIFYGGPFAPPNKKDLEHMAKIIEEREKEGKMEYCSKPSY
jgi:hypothetical protein